MLSYDKEDFDQKVPEELFKLWCVTDKLEIETFGMAFQYSSKKLFCGTYEECEIFQKEKKERKKKFKEECDERIRVSRLNSIWELATKAGTTIDCTAEEVLEIILEELKYNIVITRDEIICSKPEFVHTYVECICDRIMKVFNIKPW